MVVVHLPSCYKLRPWTCGRHQGKRYSAGLGIHCGTDIGNNRLTLRMYPIYDNYLPSELA